MGAGEPGGVRYSRDVGPGDSGMRITLRRRFPDGSYGDVLGVLTSWVDDVVEVTPSSGEVITVAASDVVAAKRIPPPPAPR